MARKNSTSNHSLPGHFGSLNMSSPIGMISGFDANMDKRIESDAHNEIESQLSQTITEPQHTSTPMASRQESNTQATREESQLALASNLHELSAEDAQMAELNMQQEEQDEAERNYRIFNPDHGTVVRSDRSLLSPREEIRSRNRQTRTRTNTNTNNDHLLTELRTKQLALLDIQLNCQNVQLDYQKVLLENAKIAQKECIEKLLVAQAVRANTLNSNNQ